MPRLAPIVRAAAREFSQVHYNRDGRVSQREALRAGMNLREFRSLDRRLDGLAGFPPEFLPVLLFDLRTNGFLGETAYAAIRRRVAGLVGPYRDAGDLVGAIDRNGDGFVSLEEARRAGLSKEDFLGFDRDRDGRIDYLGEFVPSAVNRLFEDRILREEEYAMVLAGLSRVRRWKRPSLEPRDRWSEAPTPARLQGAASPR